MTSPNNAVEASTGEFPLRLGSAEDFARVESLLKSSGYDEATLCRILKIEDMSGIESLNPDEIDFAAVESETLALLIKLFISLKPIPREEAEQIIAPAALGSLLALDILRIGKLDSDTEVCYTPILLYPVAGLLIASDRGNSPDGSPYVQPLDIVFLAIFSGTMRFLRVISKSHAADVLDLCSGTGIGALALSKHVERVVASDITARATHFARFNRLLNRCYNVEPVQGDLYSAVEGRTFDRIIAHPPYMPSLKNLVIFADGGVTGETLIRRIIEGLPRHLKPGGTFYSVCAGLDTKEEAFEARARSWLGQSQDEFDIFFGVTAERSPKQFVKDVMDRNEEIDAAEFLQCEQALNEMKVRGHAYGALAIHRRSEADGALKPLTMRTRMSASTDGSCFEWALGWHHWLARNEADGKLAQVVSAIKPRLAPSLQVKVTHVVHEGALVPAEFVLESERPFRNTTKVDPEMISVVLKFDGSLTTAEIYEAAREASLLPETLDINTFAKFAVALIERGYLEIDESILT